MAVNMEGHKEVLRFYIDESETSRYWLTVFNDMKNRGLKRILILASDNLPGISKAVLATYPNTKIQKCIAHQIRNSAKHVNYKDSKLFYDDMKKIYKTHNYDQAIVVLENFEKK